jgi:hypothetical protein
MPRKETYNKYKASVPQPPQKVYFLENGRAGRLSPVPRFGTGGSDFTLFGKELCSRCSSVEPVDITAVVNLTQIVKVPERQWIEVLDLGISLERQGENILNRI